MTSTDSATTCWSSPAPTTCLRKRTECSPGSSRSAAASSAWARTADGGARLTVARRSPPPTPATATRSPSSGVCLTVVDLDGDRFTADVMGQTLAASAIADLAEGDEVNLERAAQVGDRLGGHIVQGHVDGVGELAAVRDEGVVAGAPRSPCPTTWPRSSSTRAPSPSRAPPSPCRPSARTATAHWFEVSLIPETLTATTLGALAPGDRVNLETDVLARHVARLLVVRAR